MRVAVDVIRGAGVLDEDPAEPCPDCGCPASRHHLHGQGVQTSSGRSSHGNALMVAYCLTHEMDVCPCYRSAAEAVGDL